MATTSGFEYHSNEPATPESDRFFRLIRAGRTVRIRSGVRGRHSRLTVTTAATSDAAAAYADARIDQLVRDPYVLAYTSPPTASPDLPDDAGQSAEQLFCDTWAASVGTHIDADGTAPRRYWAAFLGVADNHHLDVGCDELIKRLIAAPHAASPHDGVAPDRLIGQCVELPHLQSRYPDDNPQISSTTHVTAVRIGPIDPSCAHSAPACTTCNQRIADLLLFFLRDNHPSEFPHWRRAALVDAAQRLVRTNAPLPTNASPQPLPT